MKKLTTKQLNIFYAKIFLNSFDENQTFDTVYQEFLSTQQYAIDRYGLYTAFEDWLRGLPSVCTIPFCNADILQLAKQTGHLSDNNEYEILDNYWSFMTNKFFWLKDRKQKWFIDNNMKG